MITYYDIPAKAPIKTWSPNPWKIRYLLNMKKLSYRTIFVEFPDIARVAKEAGIPPLKMTPDGTPYYTCPAIIDDTTGVAISDSFKIAEYLDKQYPDTPKAFPKGTEGLQAAIYDTINDKIPSIALLLIPDIPEILNDTSKEYFRRTRAASFGKPLDQIKPVGEELEKIWKNLTSLLDSLNTWYGKSSGVFMVGDQASFADFTLGALLMGMRVIWGENSEEWGKIKSLNNGRWPKLLTDLDKYSNVDA